ncbi:MAG: hypothetical protein FWD85_06930 [Microbacteriaceae bacterium]|nr:hypothetical protein [Microbacteriaceae bacterium]MCL2795024.1 hypothetical protein [Microbacteriaceae bacterium]
MTDEDPTTDLALAILHADGDVILAARRVTETALAADAALAAYLETARIAAELKATLPRPDTEGTTS